MGCQILLIYSWFFEKKKAFFPLNSVMHGLKTNEGHVWWFENFVGSLRMYFPWKRARIEMEENDYDDGDGSYGEEDDDERLGF